MKKGEYQCQRCGSIVKQRELTYVEELEQDICPECLPTKKQRRIVSFRIKETKMPKLTARGLIMRVYGGKMNFMTPIPVEYKFLPSGGAYELSRGEFLGYPIWGVTLVTKEGERDDHRSKGGFTNEKDARDCIEKISKEV